MPREISRNYMTYLATTIAKSNKLSLNTDNTNKWVASASLMQNKRPQESIITSKDYINYNRLILAPLLVNDIFPDNLTELPPSKILKFRQNRITERHRFIKAFEHFRSKLSKADDPDVLEQIWNMEQKEIRTAIDDYKRSMDIMGVVRWSGYLTEFLGISIQAVSAIAPHVIQQITPVGLGLGCIGMVINIVKDRITIPKSPYSYLGQVQSILPKDFDHFNRKLHHKFEEIN